MNRLVLEAAFPEAIGKLYVRGWRPVMWTFGGLGLVVAGLFWCVFRNRPSEHSGCNVQEQELIRSGRAVPDRPQPERRLERPPMRAILTSRSLWLMCIAQWGSNIGWVFLVTWLPRFLLEEHAVPLLMRGWMCAVPLWVGWGGMLWGGRLSDVMVQRIGLRWGRIMPLASGRFVAMTAYLFCLFHPSAWTLTDSVRRRRVLERFGERLVLGLQARRGRAAHRLDPRLGQHVGQPGCDAFPADPQPTR